MSPFISPRLVAEQVRSFLAVKLVVFFFAAFPLSGWAQTAGAVESRDIGATAIAGSDSAAGASITIRGSGADIGGTADAFRFRYQALAGDGSMKVKVPALAAGHAWAKIGLMIRDGIGANAANVFLYVTPSLHIGYQYRSAAGATTTVVDLGWVRAYPKWLWLDRQGNAFHVYTADSDDGTWTAAGTITVPMSATALFGVAVTSHDNTAAYQATLDDFILRPGTIYPPDAAPATPANLRAALPTAAGVQLTWTDNAGDETGYVVTRYAPYSAQSQAGYSAGSFTLPPNATSFLDTSALAGRSYGYTVTAKRHTYASAESNRVGVWIADSNNGNWLEQTLGETGNRGSSSLFADDASLTTALGPIGGTSDRGHFLHRPWTGDGAIAVRLVEPYNSTVDTSWGLMFRSSAAPDSATVSLLQRWGDKRVTFAIRAGAGAATTTHATTAPLPGPCWLRLTRTGDVFTAEVSSDSVTWSVMGSATVALGAQALVGPAVATDGAQGYANGRFDNLTMPGEAPVTPLAPPTNLSSDVATTREVRLSWTDASSDETSFELERRETFNSYTSWTKVATLPANTTTAVDRSVYAYQGTTYSYRVRAMRNNYNSEYSNEIQVTTPPPNASGWVGADVGTVTTPGFATVSGDGGTFTLKSTGTDFGSTGDSLRYHFRQWNGTGTIIARVASVAGGARAGIMIRESFSANSPHAALVIGSAGNATFVSRSDGIAATQAGPAAAAPRWLKLTRDSGVVTAWISPDGVAWTQAVSKTVNLTADIYLGLVVTAPAGGEATAVFDHVSFPDAAPPPAAPANAYVTASSHSVMLYWTNHAVDATGFDIYRTSYDSGWRVLVGTTTAGTTTFEDTTVRPSTPFNYQIRARRGDEVSPFVYLSVTTTASATPPPPAPTGLQVDGPTVNSLRLTWTDPSGDETGFDIYRRASNGQELNFLASVPANTVTFTDTGLEADTEHLYLIRTVRAVHYSPFSSNVSGRTLPVTTLGEWTDKPIGSSNASGTATGEPPAVTLDAGGDDIWGNADNFHYYYRTLEGDATIVTRVASLENTDNWAKAGVMIRASLDPASPHAAMLLTAGNASTFEVRSILQGATTGTNGPWVRAPYWVKLTRVGNTLTGFISPNGTAWTQIGSASLTLPSTIYVGVAASPHAYTTVQAAFDNLTATGADAPPPLVRPAAPVNVTATAMGATSVRIAWTDPANNEDGFEIYRGNSSTLIGTVSANATTFTDSSAAPDTSYTYFVAAFKGTERAYSTGASVRTPPDSPPPPAAPTNLAVGNPTASSLRLTWTDASNDETFFVVERASGDGTFTVIATPAANSTSYTDTGLAPDTSYTYQVVAAKGTVYSDPSSPATGRTTVNTNPPATWSSLDIGGTSGAGSTSGTPPTVTLNAGGADIQGTTDHFRFAAQSATGDVTIVARVASLTNTHAWAKAGVMIRTSLDGNSANAAMLLSPAQVSSFQSRATAGATTLVTTGARFNPPAWVKLTRVGNVFTGYVSINGSSWTQVASVTLALPAQVYVGLAATSHNTNAQTVAAFQNVAISDGSSNPPATPPAAPGNLYVSGSSPTNVHLMWTDNSNNEDGFEIYRQTGSAPAVLLGTIGANFDSANDTSVTANTSYTYHVKAIAGGVRSAASNSVSVTTPASPAPGVAAPTNLQVGEATTTSLRLTWTDNATDETGLYVLRVPSDGSAAAAIDLPSNTTAYTDTGLQPDKSYTYQVRASRDGTDSAPSNTVVGRTLPQTPPASDWAAQDIGNTGSAGSHSGTPPTVTLNAGGADIYGTADSFRYFARTITGDATIVARVASLTNTNSWAKAGVMIRTSLAADSANAAMLLSPAQVCSFQTRLTGGAATTATTGAWVNPPYWVKLVRSGNTFTGSVSPDGVTWTVVGTREVVMPAQVYVGVAAASHATAQTVASFTQIVVSGDSTPPPSETVTWSQKNWGTATGTIQETRESTTITSNGSDLWNAADSGVFAYQVWDFEGELVARVDSLDATDDWAKAGLVMRASGDANAANICLAVTPRSIVLQTRGATGGTTSLHAQNWSAGPGTWLKLKRTGNTFTASFSTNGSTWTTLGSQTVVLPATVHVGLAVSSHNPAVSTTAVFSGVH